MRISLRWKLVIASLLVEIVMLGCIVANSLRIHQEHLLQLTDLRLREVSVLLNAALGPSMAQQDYAAINDVFRVSLRKEGIVYFLLFDQNQHLIAQDGWAGTAPQHAKEVRITPVGDRIDARIPVILANQYYGELMFGISTGFILDARDKLIRESLAIAGIAILASFICIALLGTWLTRHLKQLETAANTVAGGDYHIKIAHTGKDEIGVVGHALNVMSERLEKEIEALKNSEKQQRDTASRLQAVFEAVPDYLTLSRLSDGMILYANRGFSVMTGYDAQYAIGKTSVAMGVWANTEDRQKWTKILLAHGLLSDFQTRLRTKNQEVKSILLSATLLEIDGQPHIVAICKDITERIEAEIRIETAHRNLQSVLDAASEVSIIATDVYGKITMFNRGAEKMLGYEASEFVGRLTPAPFHDPAELKQRSIELNERYGRHIQGIEIFTATAVELGSDIRNWTYIRKDGQRLSVSLAVTAMRDEAGNITGFLGIARDITPQVEAKQALSKLNDELEHRVTQRTAELKQANEELARAMEQLQLAQDELIRAEKLKALGNIVAVVAHELNTPIGNSMTVASTLHDRTAEVNRAFAEGNLRRSNLSEYLAAAKEGSDILMRALNRSSDLVNNFKHVAVDQATDQRRSFDLHEVLQDVIAVLTPMLRKTPYVLSLNVEKGIWLDSFPGPLEQVVTNLITNALAHAFDDRTHGEMCLQVLLPDNKTVKIIFSDNGAGIAPDHLSRIFDPFYTTKLGRGGTGLGLNIAHNIVTKMLGGHLGVHSIYGEGTTFTIEIPVCAPF